MSFQEIQGPDGPEDYSWEVAIYEEQELRQVDDRHAAVYYSDVYILPSGSKPLESDDANGTEVPTTLTVTQPNIITLTVHHRDGNPATDGAPFHYPVSAGEGWEGGFQSVEIEGPPDESQLAHRPTPAIPEPSEPQCTVPDLSGHTLRASRKILHRANCKLGSVRGELSRAARVARQYRQAGKVLPVWSSVDVKVLKVVQSLPATG